MKKVAFRKEIETLLKNPDFLIKLINSESLDFARKLFEKENVFVTDEELKFIFDFIGDIVNLNKEGKLSDDSLENISGGVGVITFVVIASLVGVGAVGYGTGHLKKVEAKNIGEKTKVIYNEEEVRKLHDALVGAKAKKELERYKTDQMVTLGATTASFAAALAALNYYKDDIYKFWNSKKKAWFGDNKGSVTKK